jgi:hypothetical protein
MLMARNTDPRWMSGPPEPTCRRCGAYIQDEDFDENGENWKCHNCGWDGTPDICAVCKKPIDPRSKDFGSSIHQVCEELDRMKDPEYQKEVDEMIMATYGIDHPESEETLDRATEMECYAIEQGMTDEELQEILSSKEQAHVFYEMWAHGAKLSFCEYLGHYFVEIYYALNESSEIVKMGNDFVEMFQWYCKLHHYMLYKILEEFDDEIVLFDNPSGGLRG